MTTIFLVMVPPGEDGREVLDEEVVGGAGVWLVEDSVDGAGLVVGSVVVGSVVVDSVFVAVVSGVVDSTVLVTGVLVFLGVLVGVPELVFEPLVDGAAWLVSAAEALGNDGMVIGAWVGNEVCWAVACVVPDPTVPLGSGVAVLLVAQPARATVAMMNNGERFRTILRADIAPRMPASGPAVRDIRLCGGGNYPGHWIREPTGAPERHL